MFLTGQAEIDKAVKQLNDAGRGLTPPCRCGGGLPACFSARQSLRGAHKKSSMICMAAVHCHAARALSLHARPSLFAVRSLPRETCGDLLVLPIYAALPPEMQAGAC